MRGSKQDVPVAFDGAGITSRQVEWGEMNLGRAIFPAGVDSAPVFVGLPDDRCQCPHWGYVVKGQFRARFKDHEEVIKAGDIYYLPPGHTNYFEEDTEVVEFSPRGEYQKTREVVARNMAAAAGA